MTMARDAANEGHLPPQEELSAVAVELCSAAAANDLPRVQEIVHDRPNAVHGKDGHGDTALAHAARRGHVEIVRHLLDSGANVRATRSGKDDRWSPLFWSVGWGAKPDMVTMLLDHGADILARADHHGAADDTVLHTAGRYADNEEIVRLLLDRGADALLACRCGDGDSREEGYTPLHSAVRAQHHPIVDLLVARGADTDAFSAAGRGLADWFGTHGADVDLTDANGETSLHWAIACRQADLARLLIAEGASLAARDRYGRTPLHAAILADADDLVALCVDSGATPDAFAHAALGQPEAVDTPDEQDAFGWTPLHWACRTGQGDTARALLERGADVNARDAEGRPPLFIAAYRARHLPTVEALVGFGADITARDGEDCGILAYDVGREIGAFLRERGATE
jgi:ankyrin repeat protein